MRIAIVTETYPPEINGVALTVEGLVCGLRARGHAVEVVRPRQACDATHVDHTLLVRGFPLPRYPGLRFGAPALRTIARRMDIAVATGFHTRFDRYMRDYGAGWLEPLALGWMRRFHNAGDATIVATQELRDFLARARFANPVRLGRAVDGTLFHPGKRSANLRGAWGAADRTLVALYIGRIAAEKNLSLAIEAFRTLQHARPDARFVFVGDGPLRAPSRGDGAQRRRAEAQAGIAGQGEAAHEGRIVDMGRVARLPRAHEVDGVAARAQPRHQAFDGEGDAVDFRRVGLGDEGIAHGRQAGGGA